MSATQSGPPPANPFFREKRRPTPRPPLPLSAYLVPRVLGLLAAACLVCALFSWGTAGENAPYNAGSRFQDDVAFGALANAVEELQQRVHHGPVWLVAGVLFFLMSQVYETNILLGQISAKLDEQQE